MFEIVTNYCSAIPSLYYLQVHHSGFKKPLRNCANFSGYVGSLINALIVLNCEVYDSIKFYPVARLSAYILGNAKEMKLFAKLLFSRAF